MPIAATGRCAAAQWQGNTGMHDTKPLHASQLYHACDLSELKFDTTEQLTSLSKVIGQDRALESIGFGIGIRYEGYNLYVMGSTGIGRHWMVTDTLNRMGKPDGRRSSDWCYLDNFDVPHRPLAICLPPGMGREFRKDMAQLLDSLLDSIPAALHSDEFQKQAESIRGDLQKREEAMAEKFDQRTREQGIALMHTPTGYSLIPIKDDKPMSPEEFDELPEERKEEIKRRVEGFRDELRRNLGQIPIWKRDMRVRYRALERDIVQVTLDQLLQDVLLKYGDYPDLVSYLKDLRQDVMDNLDLFRSAEDSEGNPVESDDPRFTRYKVNLLVDNRDAPSVPIVYEANPTYQNLLGRIEHRARMGTLATDFTLIKPGALHKANDGYLVLDAEKVLTSPFAWEALKRTLSSREIRIESIERQLSLVSTITLEPEPIPIDLKVVLIGDRRIYHLLKAYDPEFGQLFKVVVDLSETLSRKEGSDASFAQLIGTLQQREKLRPVTRGGVARVIEQSARHAGDGTRLSLHMGDLMNLLQEADYWARQDKSRKIRKRHVQQAIDQQHYRVGQIMERLQEEILEGTLMIDTHGAQLGRVNGLFVIQLGDHAFGLPSRISATARLGSGEVVDIEREVDLAGPIHSKGVFILSAYINRRYARYQPLSVAATLVFEQTYGEIEGDSASAGELCALLSALGDIPIRQNLAITGSVNQHGELQAIGGVCEKIEGFFDICSARGLDGSHGVIVPKSNIGDLMLKQEVVEAAEEGRFHVYAVKHVEAAMELLCGLPSGVADDQGVYPAGSFNGMIQQKLAEMLAIRMQFADQSRASSE
jgi:lon-related putative ATP-dependent protease